MTRPILPLLLVALLLVAPAAAQVPLEGNATLLISGAPERIVANGTQHTQEIQVTYQVAENTCAGGSETVTITVAAEAQNATVEVLPRTFTATVGPTETANGGASYPFSASIVVDAGVVAQETEVPVNVTATATAMTCSLAVFQGAPATTAAADYYVEFYPLGGINTTTEADEPVPGFELPMLLVAVLAGLLLLRRRKA
ncbi:MAG: hypothetical protein QOD77_1436 [Thermoplasmata archaeon]|jgi:MYXO-CTERM domain-containing protein|nr:hypothetical protein [Thermoplasmata archaeon]